jgi:hypothetical protein
MHIYIDEVQTYTKIFKLDSTNWIKKWNNYKSAAVLGNNHEVEEANWHSGSILYSTKKKRNAYFLTCERNFEKVHGTTIIFII